MQTKFHRITHPYEKEANKATIETLSKSKKELEKDAIEDDSIPYEEEITNLYKKIERQNQGPLYDQGMNKYQKSNESSSKKIKR